MTQSSSYNLNLPAWAHYVVPASALAASATILVVSRRAILNWLSDTVVCSSGKAAGKAYLEGNFAPVQDELFEEVQVVAGKLPTALDGCYVRVGPNPLLKPVAGYHWFDGDGMLHAVRIANGRATYCNRYVDTARLRQERAAGRPLFPRMGDVVGKTGGLAMLLYALRKRLGCVDVSSGTGTANTALTYHAGRLLALNEGDLPYGIKLMCDGLLDTMGRFVFEPSWRGPFTAHPKKDPVNGELLFLGYRYEAQPYVRVGVMDPLGNVVRQWGVQVPWPTMMHDMAATQHYVVLLHLPLVFDPKIMIEQDTLPFTLRKDLPARIGLLRRDTPSAEDASGAVQWFDVPGPGFMAFHTANAYEDGKGAVKVYACQMDNLSLDLDRYSGSDGEQARLTEYTLDLATGKASARRMTEVPGDFPVINPAYSTLPARYTWVAEMELNCSLPSFGGIAKLDMQAKPGKDACAGRIRFPAGHYGGEAVFVPRNPEACEDFDHRASSANHGHTHGSADHPAIGACADEDVATRNQHHPPGAEDDGYLMVYVYDSAKGSSALHVYDAKSMAPQPLAVVALPQRVPYGFHGTWVTGKQMKEQWFWV